MSAAARPEPPTPPPRERWPEAIPHTDGGRLLTELVIATFRLNARFLEVAQGLADHGGLTAAWWQVLGGVLDEPRSVAEIGRRMGMSRQGVQRVADLLVEQGLAEYRPNPTHRRAKLLACTETGYWAIRQISMAQHPWANRVGAALEADELRDALATMQRLVAVLDADASEAAAERAATSRSATPEAPAEPQATSRSAAPPASA
jgi:DNA-binding MarR family transcriptional regulator